MTRSSSVQPEDANPPGTLPPHGIGFSHALRTFAYIGLNSFGGPTGQIAVMHRVLVDEKKWISETRFLHALNLCMLLPGPEATQLATYVGWLLHRTRGGIAAGVLFVLPGFLAMLVLCILYTTCGEFPAVQGVLFGLRAAVLAIVIDALVRIGKRVLRRPFLYFFAVAAAAALFLFHTPFPLVIAGAGVIGLAGGRWYPLAFCPPPQPADDPTRQENAYATDSITEESAPHTRPTWGRALGVIATWVPLWLAPLAALRLWLGPGSVFAQQGIFFSKAAVVTFGGAYAVLSYVAQQAVEVYGWLRPGEMLAGLGLAETTPGPLILVLEFVAFVGAHRAHGDLPPVLAGLLAATLAIWTTFIPCFLWIFLCAPYMESLRRSRVLTSALSCITAAVVGVIFNLALWCALRTLFAQLDEVQLGYLHLSVPQWSSLDLAALLLTLAAAVLQRTRLKLLGSLAFCATFGVAWRLVHVS